MIQDYEKRREVLLSQLPFPLTPSQLRGLCRFAEQRVNARLLRQGKTLLSLEEIYESTLQELDKTIRTMKKGWDDGDDVVDILRKARRGA